MESAGAPKGLHGEQIPAGCVRLSHSQEKRLTTGLAWWTWGLRAEAATEKNDPFLPLDGRIFSYLSLFYSLQLSKKVRENKLEGRFLEMSQGRYSEGPQVSNPRSPGLKPDLTTGLRKQLSIQGE